MLGPKKMRVQKNVPKKFDPNKFWVQNYLGYKKFGPKTFESTGIKAPKKLGPKSLVKIGSPGQMLLGQIIYISYVPRNLPGVP